jgi:hypothetical protein
MKYKIQNVEWNSLRVLWRVGDSPIQIWYSCIRIRPGLEKDRLFSEIIRSQLLSPDFGQSVSGPC